jgi:hypothetical protein
MVKVQNVTELRAFTVAREGSWLVIQREPLAQLSCLLKSS